MFLSKSVLTIKIYEMKLQIVGHSMSLSMLRVDIAYREELLRISGQAANYILLKSLDQ